MEFLEYNLVELSRVQFDLKSYAWLQKSNEFDLNPKYILISDQSESQSAQLPLYYNHEITKCKILSKV